MGLKRKTYLEDDVLTAARKRISLLFDYFERVCVSISSGKDSTVLYYLMLQEAVKRNRKIIAFFLDQEAEYFASIKLISYMMRHPYVSPAWYQVPLYLTNATSYSDYFLYAWGPGERWMRQKSPIAIHKIEGDYPKRFYKFFPWFENLETNCAYCVGLRGEEGIMRYRAVTKFPGWNGLSWSTIEGEAKIFYPIYDWTVYDVWKFIYDYNLPYNKIYDLMFMDNYSIYTKMRVSNLIHEKSYKCLVDLPRYEPDTYNALCKRIGGIATATRYAAERQMFSNRVLPTHYKSWKDFRDFLLSQIKNADHKIRFEKRFSKQKESERSFRMQVGQLLVYDYEGSVAYDTKRDEKIEVLRDKWRKLL